MAQVFISFVHEDERVAAAVQSYLASHLALGDSVFMISNQYQVVAGEDWLRRIRQELSSARVVLLMMSARSVNRPWVNFEAGAGWIMNKALISVCYGAMTKDRLPKPYSNFTALNLPGQEEFLLRSIATHLNMPKPSLLSKIMNEKTTPGTLESFTKTMEEASKSLLNSALARFVDEQLS